MDHKFDRRLNVMLAISTLIAVALVVGGLLAVPAIFEGRDNSDRVAESEQISSCRAVFSAKVTDLNAQIIATQALGQAAGVDHLPVGSYVDEIHRLVPLQKAASKKSLAETKLAQAHPMEFLKSCPG